MTHEQVKILAKQKLRDEFFKTHTYFKESVRYATAPHDLFEWFYSKIESKDCEIAELKSQLEKVKDIPSRIINNNDSLI